MEAARSALTALSAEVGVPTENLLSPELVRRLCWDWQVTSDAATAMDDFLRDRGARAWQRSLVVPVLAPAMSPIPREQT